MGGPIYQELREIVEAGIWKGNTSIYGSSVRRNWNGGSFTGDPEGYVEEGSGDRHLFPQGPHGRTWKGAHLSGALRDGLRGL
jgi:hypothetical protein